MSRDGQRNRPLEVVLVVASEDDGGMARSLALLAQYLPSFGVRPHLVLHRESLLSASLQRTGTSFDIVPELIETGLRGPEPGDRGVRALLQNSRRAPKAVRRLVSICAARGADLIYSHGTWSNYLAALAGLAPSAPPVVWHIRNDHSAFGLRTAGRVLARFVPVRTVIAVSQSAAQPYFGLPVPVNVVHNGVDLAVAEAVPQGALRARLGVEASALLAGFSGRLAASKGIGVLMDAFRLAAPRLPRLCLVVLGGSARHATVDEVATLRARAAQWGLAERVHVLGYVTDAERYVKDFDLAVVPSICRDGCPRAAVEALAHGIPVIGSRIGGIPELVRDGVTGWLVPAGSADALAAALVAAGASDDRRRAMGRAAAEDARVRFDARRTASTVAAILFAATGRAESR